MPYSGAIAADTMSLQWGTDIQKICAALTLRSLSDAVDDASDRALHRARESLLDETGLESIRLAIDEARHAIDGRSRELETSVQPAISAIRPLAPPR